MKANDSVKFMLICKLSLQVSLATICVAVSQMAFATNLIVNPRGFMVNRHQDKHENGATINLWERNGHASQGWTFRNDGTIRSMTNRNFCLNIHQNSMRNHGVVNLWSCNGHNSQKWRREGHLIKPLHNANYCLNLHEYKNSNGATVNLWECNGHDSQKWVLEGR